MSKIEELRARLAELSASVESAEKYDSYAIKDEVFRTYQMLAHEEQSARSERDLSSLLEHRKALEFHWSQVVDVGKRNAMAWERVATALESIAGKSAA